MNEAVLEAAKRLSAAGIDSARLDARLLWQHALDQYPPLEGGPKFAEQISGRGHFEPTNLCQKNPADFSTLHPARGEIGKRFEELISRRFNREPVAYITGRKEFWSLDFEVGPGVLVPRPDSETLVEEAIRHAPGRDAFLRIADLGTGSGALLIAALSEFRSARGEGYESSQSAFAFARRNAARHVPDRALMVFAGWETAKGPFDLVFCNPPYIPSAEIESLAPEVRDHEPRAALDGGPDGLDAYRGLAQLLPDLLRPGGHALLEIGAGQAAAMEPLFRGLELVRIASDLAGIPRCLVLKAGNSLGNQGAIR